MLSLLVNNEPTFRLKRLGDESRTFNKLDLRHQLQSKIRKARRFMHKVW